jgi:hypothetical protein
MATGKTKALIDRLLRLRTKGNPALEHFVRVHLVLQGIDPAEHTTSSADNEDANRKLEAMIEQFTGGKEL